MTDSAGLYLHIPFCEKKCAYCDFYSSFAADGLIDEYLQSLTKEIKRWGGCFGRPIDTVYLGGGTPSLLNERIVPLLKAVRESFEILPDAEITAELNPSGNPERFLSAARQSGVNRLSVGVQSGNDAELKILGRRHTAEDAVRTVETARKLGFENLSLDLMLGLPESGEDSLAESLSFVTGLSPEHISAYLLKIEPNTLFGKQENSLLLPQDDEQARQYIQVCDFLNKQGYCHYEISNFALPGRESRHNTKYWTGGEYLGIGPAAHSLVKGRRFYYPRDLKAFLKNPRTTDDGAGGGAEEYLMLRLRLASGVDFGEYSRRFGIDLSNELLDRLHRLADAGLGILTGKKFSLTDRGMLVSNSIITEILERAL